MRILIVQTAFLGDVVLTLPLVQALQQYFPDAQIDLLTTPGHAPVLQGQAGLSAVIPYDKRGKQRGIRGFVNIVRILRSRGYDLALSPHRSLRSALLLACCGISQRIGFAHRLTNWAYTDTVPRPASGHQVEKNLQLLAPLTVSSYAPPGPFVMHVAPASRQQAQSILSRHGVEPEHPLVGMIPGSQWGTKRWPTAHFSALIQHLKCRHQVHVALFGGQQDRHLAEAIIAACQTPVIDLIGQTPLQDLAAYLDCCTVVVSNDTGPMHIA
ncbi:MAG: glycosyltransferase family 9 protein, partial [bacterium]|nr:glycosyltransferase family 9 protein [bacterium]